MEKKNWCKTIEDKKEKDDENKSIDTIKNKQAKFNKLGNKEKIEALKEIIKQYEILENSHSDLYDEKGHMEAIARLDEAKEQEEKRRLATDENNYEILGERKYEEKHDGTVKEDYNDGRDEM